MIASGPAADKSSFPAGNEAAREELQLLGCRLDAHEPRVFGVSNLRLRYGWWKRANLARDVGDYQAKRLSTDSQAEINRVDATLAASWAPFRRWSYIIRSSLNYSSVEVVNAIRVANIRLCMADAGSAALTTARSPSMATRQCDCRKRTMGG